MLSDIFLAYEANFTIKQALCVDFYCNIVCQYVMYSVKDKLKLLKVL